MNFHHIQLHPKLFSDLPPSLPAQLLCLFFLPIKMAMVLCIFLCGSCSLWASLMLCFKINSCLSLVHFVLGFLFLLKFLYTKFLRIKQKASVEEWKELSWPQCVLSTLYPGDTTEGRSNLIQLHFYAYPRHYWVWTEAIQSHKKEENMDFHVDDLETITECLAMTSSSSLPHAFSACGNSSLNEWKEKA